MTVLASGCRNLAIWTALALTAFCQPRELKPGQKFERWLAPSETHVYQFTTLREQIVRIFFRQAFAVENRFRLVCDNSPVVTEIASRQNVILSGAITKASSCQAEVVAPSNAAYKAGTYSVINVEIRDVRPGDDALLRADREYTEFRRVGAPASAEPARKLDEIAKLYASRGESDFEGWALLLAGQYWVRLSDYRQAAARYLQSSKRFRDSGDAAGLIEALDFEGDISAVLRDYPRAIEVATEELAIARERHLSQYEAAALTILGRSSSELGDKQRALDLFLEAIAVARSAGDRTRESAGLRSAASLYNMLGDHGKALASYHEVLQIERARGQKLNEAAALSNIGSSHAAMKQNANATRYFLESIALFRSTDGGRPALATTLTDCGQVYLADNEPAIAVPLLEEALTISRETSNRWSEAYALATLSDAHAKMRDLSEGAKLAEESVRIAHIVQDPQLQGIALYQLSRVEREQGNLRGAQRDVGAAIGFAEILRKRIAVPDLKSSLIASVANYYELQVDVLMQLHRETGDRAFMEQAQIAAESLRARNLLDVLAMAGLKASTKPNVEDIARERALRKSLGEVAAKRDLSKKTSRTADYAKLDRQIEDIWTEYQSVRSKISASDPVALSVGDSGTDINLAAIQKEGLDSQSLLLEYSLGEARSFLWVVSSDSIASFVLPARATIEQAARSFRSAVQTRGDATASARRLSNMILAPAGHLLARRRLLIVADGALQHVPFAAIADPSEQNVYCPLIQAHDVIAEPSASTLVLLRRGGFEGKTAPRTAAIFADPVFEADDPRIRKPEPVANVQGLPSPFLTRAAELQLRRLPSTRREGQAIAALIPESQRWLALDFDASRETAMGARLKDYQILHFATHGVVDTSHPELTALALSLYNSRGRPQDGFLRLYEIFNLNLRASLVVLSACQTALGKDVRGEGLIGLARGFMHAGVPRVVATLWNVDDEASSELMRSFYAAMLGADKKSPAAALRQAQTAVASQERWRAPYYWAGFILQGEWK